VTRQLEEERQALLQRRRKELAETARRQLDLERILAQNQAMVGGWPGGGGGGGAPGGWPEAAAAPRCRQHA
jgi:hypothetical protein